MQSTWPSPCTEGEAGLTLGRESDGAGGERATLLLAQQRTGAAVRQRPLGRRGEAEHCAEAALPPTPFLANRQLVALIATHYGKGTRQGAPSSLTKGLELALQAANIKIQIEALLRAIPVPSGGSGGCQEGDI